MYIKIVLKFSSQTSKSEMKPIYYAKKNTRKPFRKYVFTSKNHENVREKKEYL